MKYVDEFRNRSVATAIAERIKQTVRRLWTIMEVCGGRLIRLCDSGSITCCREISGWLTGERGTDH